MICRFAIAIPVYDNPSTILGVIQGCLTVGPFEIFVVDDGSERDVQEMFLDMYGPQSRIHWLRHETNLGKGSAIQTAFKAAIQRGFTHLITLDGDGQHDPRCMKKLIDCSERNPRALVVGDRNMSGENVPTSSRFGKAFSNFWIRYQTGRPVGDSQSGYRIYPLFFVQHMRFICKSYDFEIEVLTRLIWKGIRVENVPIHVNYFSGKERVSHFGKWRDNAKISVINTVLTLGSLLHERTSPFLSSLAFGIGIFIGCSPFFGLHSAIAFVVSLLGRLNFVYLWLGTNISVPPLIPVLTLSATSLGSYFFPSSSSSVMGLATTWLLGATILGLILGTAGFCVMFVVKTLLGARSSRSWTGRHSNRAGIAFVHLYFKVFGLKATYQFLKLIVFYYLLASWKARQAMGEYWKITHPTFGFFKRQVMMYKQLLLFAQTLTDRGYQSQSSDVDCFEFTNAKETEAFPFSLLDRSAFMERLEDGSQGMVLVTSHVGGWELALTQFVHLETRKEIVSVMHGVPGQYAHSSRKESNQGERAKTIYYNLRENSIMDLKRQLTLGHAVGVMGDRPVTASCEILPFFGKLAYFDTTPFRLALACNSSVTLVFSFKIDSHHYTLYLVPLKLDPMDDSLSTQERVVKMTMEYVRSLECLVRKHPTQWFNFFRFWSVAPVQESLSRETLPAGVVSRPLQA